MPDSPKIQQLNSSTLSLWHDTYSPEIDACPIHLLAPCAWLSANHIKKLTPPLKTTKYQQSLDKTENLTDANGVFLIESPGQNIEIFEPLTYQPKAHFFQSENRVLLESTESGLEALSTYQAGSLTAGLLLPHVEEFIIPIGPSHWRAASIQRQKTSPFDLSVKLFGPFGLDDGLVIKPIIETLLKRVDKNLQKYVNPKTHLTISYQAICPPHPQQDGYACGDFILAFIHQRLLEKDCNIDVDSHAIKIYQSKGNQQGALRNAWREKSKTLFPQSPSSPTCSESDNDFFSFFTTPQAPKNPIEAIGDFAAPNQSVFFTPPPKTQTKTPLPTTKITLGPNQKDEQYSPQKDTLSLPF